MLSLIFQDDTDVVLAVLLLVDPQHNVGNRSVLSKNQIISMALKKKNKYSD